MNFKKSVHNALWGSESWEISAHPSDPSVIADGEEKGRRLNEIYPNFPLLFKVIDAKTRLSVQVHPNEETKTQWAQSHQAPLSVQSLRRRVCHWCAASFRCDIESCEGKTFTMIAKNLSKENKYVKAVTLNGKPIVDWKMRHTDILKGGELVFEMGNGDQSP